MKRVILYPRVSTDEQADKGYSLRDQEEKLLAYCRLHNKEVVGVFPEDFSAWKGFNRPSWNKILAYLKANKGKVDEILFIKWDRFSRNAPDAYQMLSVLSSLNVKPMAIEQPIDMMIPENKIMLAFYLAAPEVENDRRSLSTRDGIRRAKLEGRYLGKACFGYINAKDNQQKPIILIDQNKKSIIENIFDQYVAGTAVPLILQEARSKGYPLRKHGAIQATLTNHAYAGLIKVNAHRDLPEQIVKGLHQPIITEDLFWKAYYKVQQERQPQLKTIDDKLPLRGFLICPTCSHPFTGGPSKGKKQYYWYYSCNKCRKQNHSAIQVDKDMTIIMQGLNFKPHEIKYLKESLHRKAEKRIKESNLQEPALKREHEAVEKKITSLEEKFIGNYISNDTYTKWHPVYHQQLQEIKSKLNQSGRSQEAFRQKVENVLPLLTDMNFIYNTQANTVMKKQTLLKGLFPGCLIKYTNFYRTPYVLKMFASKILTLSDLLRVDDGVTRGTSSIVPLRVDDGNETEHFLTIIQNLMAA